MTVLLLITIYLAFISMGLPDSMLGSAWPAMRLALNVDTQMAGFVSLAISASTVISSLFSSRAIARWGTGKVTVFSVALTVAALFGFSVTKHFALLILLAIPQGLGAGAIDAALSNYVALHFKAKHMNWLHCFWGVGAMTSPVILSSFLAGSANWRGGYQAVGTLQTALLLILILALPLWRKVAKGAQEGQQEEAGKTISNSEVLRIRGTKPAILSLLFYNGSEAATGLWASTYFTSVRGLPVETAAAYTSSYFFGIMAGRVVSGFLSERISSKALIRAGIVLALLGLGMLMLPVREILPAVALFLFGFGGAPIYPSVVHDTPARFGKQVSQSIVGMELAGAYVGTTTIPLIVGFAAGQLGERWIPVAIIVFFTLMLASCERANKVTGSHTP